MFTLILGSVVALSDLNKKSSVQLYNEARSLFQDIERNPSHPPTFGKFKNRLQNLELAARGAKVYALVNVEKVLEIT